MKLELDPQEIVIVLNQLGQMPWAQVNGLMQKLMQQIKEQNTDNVINLPNA